MDWVDVVGWHERHRHRCQRSARAVRPLSGRCPRCYATEAPRACRRPAAAKESIVKRDERLWWYHGMGFPWTCGRLSWASDLSLIKGYEERVVATLCLSNRFARLQQRADRLEHCQFEKQTTLRLSTATPPHQVETPNGAPFPRWCISPVRRALATHSTSASQRR